MRSKFSILFIVLFFSLCSNSSDVNSDKIIISNLDLEPLLENVDVNELDTNLHQHFQAMENELDTNFLIINYWASWCLECIEEHELLISLAETKKLEGKVAMVSFQDSRDSAIEFLNNYGYGQIIYAVDTQSKLAIDSGVFGVPETHIIVNGEIVKKFIGPLSLSNVEEIINNFP